MDFITNFWNSFINGFPDIVVAIIYLILAFVVAGIAKSIVTAILRKLGAEKLLAKIGAKEDGKGNAIEMIGKLVFLIVFLLFLPAVLTRLGMSSVASPITNVIGTVIDYLPQLLAAVLIVYIGIYVAKIVKQLIKALLNKVGVDKLQKKLGFASEQEQNTFSEVIAGIIYALILIPVIIAALQVVGLDVVADPATTILAQIFSYIPNIFVSLILLVVGYQLSKIIAPLVESLLISVGADKLMEKIFAASDTKTFKFSLAKIVGLSVRWLILIVFFIEAVDVLNLAIFTTIGSAILGYIPLVISAAIIIGGGVLLASWLERLIIKHSPKQKTVALITKIVIIVFAAFMSLSQLGFAQSIVNLAFVIILTGATIAFAVAFGFGGKTFAANRLAKLEKKLDDTGEASNTDSAE